MVIFQLFPLDAGNMEYSTDDKSNIPSRMSSDHQRQKSCSRCLHNHQPIASASSSSLLLLSFVLFLTKSSAAIADTTQSAFLHPSSSPPFSGAHTSVLHGWLDNFLPKPILNNEAESSDNKRRLRYPEQYPATYELLPTTPNDDSNHHPDVNLVRPLLKSTQLESRSLEVVYDAMIHGWDATAFHSRVDGRGAAIVLARVATEEVDGDNEEVVGGYNPKGWASMGGARPSVAAFLFYHRRNGAEDDGGANTFQKLRKIGGGGMACANDNPDFGIAFGPDGLLIPLLSNTGRDGSSRGATSKLGTYYERGPEERSSIFRIGKGTARLSDLKVLVGVYEEGEEIPYAGAVLDMTSG